MNTPRSRSAVGLAFAALILFAVPRSGLAAALPVNVSKVSLRTGNGEVHADVFETPGARSGRAVLVLHGAGGTLIDGPEMRRAARHLAAAGSTVYLVHYFDATGTLFARDPTMRKHFGEWLQTVRDSILAIQKLRGDNSPVGIYGYSLGAFLALLAASDNPRVAIVVEHAGGIWDNKMERVGKMPAVLMIHGERDARVPFEKYAKPLLSVLRARASKVETRFFPDEGHGFTPTAMAKVREEAATFFRANLR